MQYITIVGLTLATATFVLGLLADVTLSRKLFLAKNALSVASAPLEVLISVLYWGLRAVCIFLSPVVLYIPCFEPLSMQISALALPLCVAYIDSATV